MTTPRELQEALGFDYVIVVTRQDLKDDTKSFTEVYGPFTKVEVEAEALNDSSPTLYDPVMDTLNCIEWEAYPIIYPTWLYERGY